MSYNLKENVMKEDRLSGGHRMCAGCGSPIAVRTVLRALNPEDHAVVCFKVIRSFRIFLRKFRRNILKVGKVNID